MSQAKTQVTKMVMFPSATYHDQVAYNYTTTLKPYHMQAVEQATYNHTGINANAFAGLSGDMMSVDPSSARQATVANGFGTQRLRFVIYVQKQSSATNTQFIYSGYTDHYGVSAGGHSDPNMRLYFNNCLTISQVQTYDAVHGAIVSTQVHDSSHILHPSLILQPPGIQQVYQNNPYDPNLNSPVALTPGNVMNNLAYQGDRQLMSQMNNYMGGDNNSMILDTRTHLNLGFARRTDVIPAQYMAQTAKAYVGSLQQADRATDNVADLYNNAAGSLSSRNIYTDAFLTGILSNADYQMNGYVTWADLLRLNPEIGYPDITKRLIPNQMQMHSLQTAMQNFDPNVGDNRPETLLVNQLVQTVTPLMLDNLMSSCAITATNMLVNGGWDVQVYNVGQYVGLPQGALMERADRFRTTLGNIIFRDLGGNNDIPLMLQMGLDAFGDTHVKITYNGGHPIDYMIPSFMDAVQTPILALTKQPLDTMSSDLGTMFTHMYG